MKVLITGSRTWKNVVAILSELKGLPRDSIIVHGACPTGADLIADRLARDFGYTIRRYPANWEAYGRLAGPIRNTVMIKAENVVQQPIDLCLAFLHRESKGTRDCMNKAVRAGIPVRRIDGE